MRFDNFEELWNKFKVHFNACGVNKEDAKSVFDVNFGALKKVSEGANPYLGESIDYIDTNNGGLAYNAFHEGPVYIFPAETKISSNTNNEKALAFSPLTSSTEKHMLLIKIEEGNLIIEKYFPENKTISVEVYSGVIEMLEKRGVTFGNIHFIEQSLKEMLLVPDKSVKISNNSMVVNEGGMISHTSELNILPDVPFYNQAIAIIQEQLAKTNGFKM